MHLRIRSKRWRRVRHCCLRLLCLYKLYPYGQYCHPLRRQGTASFMNASVFRLSQAKLPFSLSGLWSFCAIKSPDSGMFEIVVFNSSLILRIFWLSCRYSCTMMTPALI